MKELNLLFTALLLMCCVGTAKAEEVTIDGINYNVSTGTKQATVIWGGNYSGDIVIPSEITYNNVTCNVTSIGGDTFSGCTKLTSITIPNNITSIGDYAFYGCSGLTSVTIPNSVTWIGENAFYGCKSLKKIELNCGYISDWFSGNSSIEEVIIGNNVTSIGDCAFSGCSGLKSITIPSSVTSIGDNAFDNTAWWKNQSDGLVYKDGWLLGHKGNIPTGNIVIKDGTTWIANNTFTGCFGLTSITIPNSVTSIGEEAFYLCNELKEVHINDLAAWCSIDFGSSEANPLYYAHNLYLNNELITELDIPNGVTSIGKYAFSDYSGLTSITIPNSVTSIGNKAFYNCKGLTSITIPNSVTSIGDGAFEYCDGLKEVHINDIAAWCNIDFGNYYANPLYYALNLYLNNELITELVIPNGVTSIGNYAFWGCSGFTSITIPNSVTSIGWSAFSNCENLADVYCLATNVPETRYDWGDYYNPFSGSYPESMTLHVPAEAINSYKTTEPWSRFGNVVAIIIEKPKCAAPVIEYYNGELVIECKTENTEFVTTITNDYTGNYNSNAIALTATYNISVYATATGHDNSDTVNATLCWIECDCSADNNTTDVINVPAKAVFVTSSNGTININCALEGEIVELYTSDAMYIGSTTIENGTATIESGLSKGDIAIIKIAEKSIKVILN